MKKNTSIEVSKCEDIGYFKVPKYFEEDLKDKML